MECLDANVVQGLMSGALDEAVRASVLGHLDTCDDCRELVGATAKITLEDQLGTTQPYPDELVPPSPGSPSPGAGAAARDIGLDQTMAPDRALETTRDSDSAIAVTMPPPGRCIPPRRSREPAEKGPFGRYLLDDKLGAGAMGVVWRAHDPKLGRMVALKLLHRYDPALMDRLVREARSMAQVSHPNVVGVFDVGETEGAAFIAMELVTGRSLRTWQTDQNRTISELVTAYVAAGRGLSAAHGAGIVHRDFKADNVLVGDDARIRVTDFGLAAAKPSESGTRHSIDDVNLTAAGSVLGTPAYMAPEQFTGGHVDPRTDQFNFCVSLYEALYGERPFVGTSYDELAENVIEGRLRPPPHGSQVSGGLRAILARGLAPKPADRFPSMDHLLVELARDRARPWRRTGWVALAVAAALGVGLVADWKVRDRIGAQIAESFELTGVEVDKTMHRVENEFELASKVAYSESALREVAGHHDQADFGLGTAAADREDLEKLHGTLASMQWQGLATEARAIVDYKGRLLFTSFAPQVWNTDMRAIPAVERALDTGTGSSIVITSYADPMFAPSQVFGSAPPHGLVLMHLQALALGNDTTGANETRAILVQFEDAGRLLGDLRLDPETLLAIVAPNHTSVADEGLTDRLIALAPRDGIAQVHDRDHDYQVLQFPISDREHHEIGQVVMARRVDGMLMRFPRAALVLAIGLALALGIALATLAKARQLTGARAA
ncbi:MAG: serine/threonine-protein kinase [Kofleriaceae bacterium]